VTLALATQSPSVVTLLSYNFPAKGPLESVAMDILGPLPRTKHGNRFLLVIADPYTKVTRTVPLRKVTALSVARAFVDQWVYVSGPPVSLLT
jgi:hypothetical protein